jgi:hypothetical protein
MRLKHVLLCSPHCSPTSRGRAHPGHLESKFITTRLNLFRFSVHSHDEGGRLWFTLRRPAL